MFALGFADMAWSMEAMEGSVNCTSVGCGSKCPLRTLTLTQIRDE